MHLNEEEGFSLVEILVAITISGLLIGFTSVVWLMGQKYYSRWDRAFELQNEVQTIMQGISEDVFRADQLIEISTKKLVLMRKEKKREYTIQDDQLFRGETPLIKSGIELVLFEIYIPKKNDAGRNQLTNIHSTENITSIGIDLVLANRNDTLHVERVVTLRKPSTWKSLEK